MERIFDRNIRMTSFVGTVHRTRLRVSPNKAPAADRGSRRRFARATSIKRLLS